MGIGSESDHSSANDETDNSEEKEQGEIIGSADDDESEGYCDIFVKPRKNAENNPTTVSTTEVDEQTFESGEQATDVHLEQQIQIPSQAFIQDNVETSIRNEQMEAPPGQQEENGTQYERPSSGAGPSWQRNPARGGSPQPMDIAWEETVTNITPYEFRSTAVGPTFEIDDNSTCEYVFNQLFTADMIDYMVERTNAYGAALTNANRPHTRYARNSVFRATNPDEMKKFLGLTLLNGHIRVPQQRKLFTYDDPLYYHPVFHYTMSCRRYEQILRCLYVADLGAKGSSKIEGFINTMTQNFRYMFNPGQDRSLDESLLLYRGRLIFRHYIKSKKARYGIKFYILTTADGYVLNIKMYSGGEVVEGNERKTDRLVLRLMRPYLLKGHNLYMDNYYNSVTLSQKLLDLKTHTNGTLRKTRKDNPKFVVQKKLKKGQHVWARKGKVYVSAWKDKREVYMVTTMDHPALIEVTNRFGKKKMKPKEVDKYNKYMSGVDRSDQIINYYSSPRKTIRWYKKVLFHIVDTAVWNSYYIYKKYVKKDNKYEYITYRDELIKKLIGLKEEKGKDLIRNSNKNDSRRHALQLTSEPEQHNTQKESSQPANHGHWPTRMTPSTNSKKKYAFLSCKQCSKNKVRRDTSYFCKGCYKSPALCPSCFEDWHKDM
ncbi:piggyBac transposable element-derived protein 4-like [Melitaea cinxia]|uniref:piggyBac transposable element-derived protein 4-like n=1 Tax=Melitaea cinxia TaxID=113334 RepID=UPI001E270FE4|nr:piggyBac transposable element-derived protein 4-like [Melitaea cinxia]